LNRRSLRDYAGLFFSWLASSIMIAACFGIILYLVIKGIGQVNLKFLISEPSSSFTDSMGGGISTPMLGTVLLTLIGIAIALPWALATAIFLAEYGGTKKSSSIFRTGVDVLSGVPTIVIAIFGVAIFSNPKLGFLSSMVESTTGINKAFGRSFLVAGITMAVMILPFVIKTCEEAIKSVPNSYREASLAMGASKWHTIVKIVIPSAKNGIVTSVILGMGRIIGDTAIVWLTLGGTLRMTGLQPWWDPGNWMSTLTNTGSTLTSYIFYASPAGEGNMEANAFGASLVLIVIILLLNMCADFIIRGKKVKGED
jgi:phosphate transport system permease protein